MMQAKCPKCGEFNTHYLINIGNYIPDAHRLGLVDSSGAIPCRDCGGLSDEAIRNRIATTSGRWDHS